MIALAWTDPALWIAILMVAVGLGFVIFVHELGHFAVAKLCGVKCEKFYLGFDIAGLKLCKFTWGETEYGIGILPLGGYVKMLGQEDNPARLREEIERAKQDQAAGSLAEDPAAQSDPAEAGDSRHDEAPRPEGEKIDVEAAERALYDPRSYLAKSVPKRMAIISAGVIMNLIFAFVMATVAFSPGMGVRQMVCGVGQVMPGEAAWQENVKVGTEILQVGGKECRKFRDMQTGVSLGDIEQGIAMVTRPPGEKEPRTITLMPNASGLLPKIGIASPWTTTLRKKGLAVLPGSPAAQCDPPFQLGDKIVKGDGKPLENYAQLHAALALNPDKPLTVTVRRSSDEDRSRDEIAPRPGEETGDNLKNVGQPGTITMTVAPKPMRRLGLVMEMGEISAVQTDSPAAKAGIRPGDKIALIDGQPPGDPMTLPERLRQRAGQTIILTVTRETEKNPIKVDVNLRRADWYEMPIDGGNPISVPSLGIAYPVLSRVRSAIEGMPAAEAGLRNGDEIVAAKLIPPEKQTSQEKKREQIEADIEFDEENRNWPFFIYGLQQFLPGTRVELRWVRQGEEKTATLEPVEVDDWFDPERGFLFEPEYFYQTAYSWGEAIQWGAGETFEATLLVYRFLQKLGAQQVSPRALGGPVAIFVVAKRHAEQGPAELLIFLTLLSANLAVLNFLPIPLLDGGHMVLLAWEGIRGKPADERVQLALTYLGLIFILTLMAWVLGLDFGLIPRR